MSTDRTIEVSLLEARDFFVLGQLWTSLQARSDHSYFTSWSWMQCWLRQLPAELCPRVVVATLAGEVVGLAILHRRQTSRGGIIGSQVVFLNETGVEALDMLTIEHNSILADRRVATDVHRACLNFLLETNPDWDEFYAPGIDADSDLDRVLSDPPAGVRCKVERECPCYVADLTALRESGCTHLSTLSSHAQKQMRKSMRLYETQGPLTVDCASTLDEARAFYESLKQLHQSYWTALGEVGAFGTEFTDGFHRSLIESGFPRGEVQLLRIRAGEAPIGFIYSFVYQGHVLAYQTAFVYEDNNAKKPGMVSHLLAIEYNLKHGAALYDFLGGDARYKQSLGQPGTPLRWLVWQRPRLRFHIEEWLRAGKRRLAPLSRLG